MGLHIASIILSVLTVTTWVVFFALATKGSDLWEMWSTSTLICDLR